ncbi:hypothetical protein DIRU0_E26610 [Diutina rugosa]
MTPPIYIKMEPVRKSPDDHPEPEFRPQSCGKDAAGRLIPSTSSISLLNLNNDIPRSPSMMMSPQPSDRKNSFAHHQRLHHYRSVYSPPNDQPSSPVAVPDSPSLDPTSLGGSPPSRLWLSSSAAPATAAGEAPSPSPASVPGFHQVRQTVYIRTTPKPAMSPVLFPVQTPLEEPPITPLTLTHSGPTWTSYFDDVIESANES